MRELRVWLVSLCVFAAATAGFAKDDLLDCSKKSLADAVRDADTNQTIRFTGACAGPLVIATEGLTLQGVGTAIVDGGGNDAVIVPGTGRVSLIDFEVTNGLTGIVARDGAHVSLSGVKSHNNSGDGVSLQTASTAAFSEVFVNDNGRTGVIADNGVGITMVSSTITGNTIRDIQLTFGTRADLRTLTFGGYTCDATVLVRGTSGIVCPH